MVCLNGSRPRLTRCIPRGAKERCIRVKGRCIRKALVRPNPQPLRHLRSACVPAALRIYILRRRGHKVERGARNGAGLEQPASAWSQVATKPPTTLTTIPPVLFSAGLGLCAAYVLQRAVSPRARRRPCFPSA